MILAVYGTLRRGGPSNHLLMGAKYIGRDTVKGRLISLGDFPGFKTDGDTPVVVDLYEVDTGKPETLSSIDRYEGFYPDKPDQSLYFRKEVTTEKGLSAVIYVYRFDGNVPITSGDWFDAP